ncbi:MAG: acyltransferase [Mariprofundaceae bacterium]|nr:acyltransferase [Mariprofundaceae bacterium]
MNTWKKYFYEHFHYLSTAGKYSGIDTLRFLAIVSVILFHTSKPDTWFFVVRLGWLGVDLFFVISGFLIGSIIIGQLNQSTFSFRLFYKNRCLRILPTYYFIILATVLAHKFLNESNDSLMWESIAYSMLFFQTTGPYFSLVTINNYFVPGGTWSLVVEEYFYILIPIFLYAVSFINKKMIPYVLVSLVILAIPLNSFITSRFQEGDFNWFFANSIQFHSRYVGLCLGVFAAYLIRSKYKKNIDNNSFLLFLVFIMITTVISSYFYVYPEFLKLPKTLTWQTIFLPTFAGIGFFFLILSYYHVRSVKWIVVIARLSFPLYLVHIFFLNFSHLPSFNAWPVLSLVTLLICIPISYFLSLAIEYPCIQLYKKSKLSKPVKKTMV